MLPIGEVVSLIFLLKAPGIPALGQVAAHPPTTQQTQKVGVAPALSPGAAYQEAMRPVEITRRSIANWSQTEQASLAVSIRQASDACAERSYDTYSGNDLADYARLCSLGQAWPVVILAANRYVGDKANETRLAEVYAEKIDADLHLKKEPEAVQDTRAMLGVVPYKSTAADASDEALNYMEVLYTPDAIQLADLREPLILQVLVTELAASPTELSEGMSLRLSIADLYRQGIRLAFLQQLDGQTEAAKQSIRRLDDAAAFGLTSDDRLKVAAMQHTYAQLGQPLGVLRPSSSLDVSGHLPDIPAHNAITVLLLFPDWCAQCIRLGRQIPGTVFTVEGHEAYAFSLLVQTVPPQTASKASHVGSNWVEEFDPALAARYLQGTPTVTIESQLLSRFNAVDIPMLIATDSHGIARYIGTAADSALQPGQTVDSLVAIIGKRWPTVTFRQEPSVPKAR